MTSTPNADESFPSLEVISFRPCAPTEDVAAATTPAAAAAAAAPPATTGAAGADAAKLAGAFTTKKVPIESLVLPSVPDPDVEDKRSLAVEINPVGSMYAPGGADKGLRAFKSDYDVTLDPNYQVWPPLPPSLPPFLPPFLSSPSTPLPSLSFSLSS